MAFDIVRGYTRRIEPAQNLARLYDDAAVQYMEVATALISGTPVTLAAHVFLDDATINQGIVSINSGIADGIVLEASGGAGGD